MAFDLLPAGRASALATSRRRLRVMLAVLCAAVGLLACRGSRAVSRPFSTDARVPSLAASNTRRAVFPDSAWPVVHDLAAAGYDPARFDSLRARVTAEGTSAMLVVVEGRVVFAHGDVGRATYLASARKSVVSMLYGRHVAAGTVRLDATLASLGVDDLGGLLPVERTATVNDVLTARSGVYHPAANLGDASAMAPPRGSVRPGSYFLYNNWDFNVLGTILERATGVDLHDLMERDLVRPLGFQDWVRADQPKRNDTGASRHPAHHMVLSTRDMARLGYCMLRGGRWRDAQLVPEEWVARTTRTVTPAAEVARTSPFDARLGYGYLWWVLNPTAAAGQRGDAWAGAYTASGSYGQYITVLPAIDVVVAHKVFAPPQPAQQVRIDAYLDRILPLVIAATTTRVR
jgi:CubicO group peptidase (beta-lactamase class C family)